MLWREVRTRAYGKKTIVIRLAYWVVFAVCLGALVTAAGSFGAIAGCRRRPRA